MDGVKGLPNVDDIVSGQVKWFDRTKGYGFVVAETVDQDILLHANVLRNFGQNSVADGSPIAVRVVATDRGIQAQEILRIDAPPACDGGAGKAPGPHPEPDDTRPLMAARVKWFDRGKGFGFANVFGRPEDVFIHMDVLRRSSLADLQPGEAIAVRVIEGDRGCLATSIATWEAAVPHA